MYMSAVLSESVDVKTAERGSSAFAVCFKAELATMRWMAASSHG
jgi:hypothetical protein